MKQNAYTLSLLLIIVISLTVACSGPPDGTGQEQAPEASATVEFGTPVEVADVETGDLTLIYSYNGNLQATDDINILPNLAGKIETVLVKEGDAVKAGEPLAIIEKEVYQAQLKQAEAGLRNAELNVAKMRLGTRPEEIAVAQAGVEVARAALDDVATINDDERTTAAAAVAQAQARLRDAQADYDAIAWAGNVGTTREAIELEQATIAYENALAAFNLQTNPSDSQLAPLIVQLAQAELNLILKQQPFREVDFAIAESGVAQAQAGVELAQLQLDNTVIEAPFDGVIAELNITQGSTVGPQSPVARFISETVEVAIEIEESRINQIFEGQSVSLRLVAFPGRDFPATVTSIAPVADEETRTFTIKITPANEEGLLRAGMYADVSLLADEKENVTLIPREALVQRDSKTVVYVVKQGVVHEREVETGLSDGEKVEILSGLEAGETVVTAGQLNLLEGAKVEVTNRL